MFPCDWVGYVVIEIVLGEGVGGDVVGHEGGVVCGTEKLIKNFKRFVPFLQ